MPSVLPSMYRIRFFIFLPEWNPLCGRHYQGEWKPLQTPRPAGYQETRHRSLWRREPFITAPSCGTRPDRDIHAPPDRRRVGHAVRARSWRPRDAPANDSRRAPAPGASRPWRMWPLNGACVRPRSPARRVSHLTTEQRAWRCRRCCVIAIRAPAGRRADPSVSSTSPMSRALRSSPLTITVACGCSRHNCKVTMVRDAEESLRRTAAGRSGLSPAQAVSNTMLSMDSGGLTPGAQAG